VRGRACVGGPCTSSRHAIADPMVPSPIARREDPWPTDLGALEQDVLQEVRRAIVLVRLEPAARVDPDADRGGLSKGQRLRGDAQAVGQGRDLRGAAPPGEGLGGQAAWGRWLGADALAFVSGRVASSELWSTDCG
jgi:hypothetical protein